MRPAHCLWEHHCIPPASTAVIPPTPDAASRAAPLQLCIVVLLGPMLVSCILKLVCELAHHQQAMLPAQKARCSYPTVVLVEPSQVCRNLSCSRCHCVDSKASCQQIDSIAAVHDGPRPNLLCHTLDLHSYSVTGLTVKLPANRVTPLQQCRVAVSGRSRECCNL